MNHVGNLLKVLKEGSSETIKQMEENMTITHLKLKKYLRSVGISASETFRAIGTNGASGILPA